MTPPAALIAADDAHHGGSAGGGAGEGGVGGVWCGGALGGRGDPTNVKSRSGVVRSPRATSSIFAASTAWSAAAFGGAVSGSRPTATLVSDGSLVRSTKANSVARAAASGKVSGVGRSAFTLPPSGDSATMLLA